MTVVLVTRPDKQGEILCQKLAMKNIVSIYNPLILIQPELQLRIISLAKKLHTFDIIIAVSQHAVTYMQKTIASSSLVWPKSAEYFAIGKKTAQILSKATQQIVHYPKENDSEHLLSMSELSHVKNKKVSILRGNGGRELIFETLSKRQAIVRYQQIYQRVLLPLENSNIQILQWKNKGVDSLVVTSTFQLKFLLSQIIEPYHRIWFQGLDLFVPSKRIVFDAKKMGFNYVISTGSASNAKLVKALCRKNRKLFYG
ncbi:uroporphyrinogen-III synthase [Candidatus Photodesmus katoptron]|uniref:Uroporphyrinogen-III synthase n=1 Tax=Candidatus Photodesmus katoptron Akat1 TaxID=1236703 RepID=S3DK28_9GAMM|nr:uroporphyrinogen-III synthase [Candidatus Photodesmus katoptron]EPE37504.1 uroporphyrinogen-III synthase HemD [Candidatus Photodesmus katoptron Akat1]KEY90333.1 uroporphyrinogen-III synthase [Candidatus Photodesmus katoptron]